MRPGNRPSPTPRLTGKPGNRLPGALYSPQLGLARDAAAQVEQASAAASQPPSGTQTVTSDVAFGPSDAVILVDASSGPVTVTLPAVSGGARTCEIRKVDASANAAILEAAGTDTVNGGASVSTTTQYDAIVAITDGVNEWLA